MSERWQINTYEQYNFQRHNFNCLDFNSSSAAMQLDKIRLMSNGTEY